MVWLFQLTPIPEIKIIEVIMMTKIEVTVESRRWVDGKAGFGKNEEIGFSSGDSTAMGSFEFSTGFSCQS